MRKVTAEAIYPTEIKYSMVNSYFLQHHYALYFIRHWFLLFLFPIACHRVSQTCSAHIGTKQYTALY